LIHHQIHDVALALGADQFQGQQAADSLRGGNHFRTWQPSCRDDMLQMNAIQERHKQKQSGQGSAKGTGGQIRAAHISDLGDLRLYGGRALVIRTAGEAREAFLAEQDDHKMEIPDNTVGDSGDWVPVRVEECVLEGAPALAMVAASSSC
jgi:hypothetical protein